MKGLPPSFVLSLLLGKLLELEAREGLPSSLNIPAVLQLPGPWCWLLPGHVMVDRTFLCLSFP